MPGQRFPVLDWPYVEGLRIDEAMHPLTILAVGLYGETLPNQNGAPLRLVVPWKYGFKSIKSIVEIRFTEQQPPTTWNLSAPRRVRLLRQREPGRRPSALEPGAGAAHRRRRVLAARQPTLLFNGYAEQVAGLYAAWTWRRTSRRAVSDQRFGVSEEAGTTGHSGLLTNR